MISIQTEDFDLGREQAELRIAAGDAGAIVTFTGLVREVYDQTASEGGSESKNESVVALTLEHYPGMTEKSLESIRQEAGQRWQLHGLTILHRVGKMHPGDKIVAVIACSRHRQNAFDACAFAMDYLKTEAPFWKLEDDGKGEANWVDARDSDHSGRDRWQSKET